MNIAEFLEYKIFEVGDYSLTVYKLVILALIYLATKVLGWFIKKAIVRHRESNKLDQGSEYAILAIIRYVIGIVAIVFALEIIGVQVTILVAGSAALLVGVGLGLQQTFNDVISGIILLLEGNTKVGDILQIDDMVVKLQHIGLRTSKVLNRDDIIVIIPNSIIVTNKVINWSHQINHTRFRVAVGVAYGSDVDLVMQILEDCARENKCCSKVKPPQARFLNFGDSSLDFEVVFWSTEMFRIEKALSDIRRAIDQKFRENGVSIPFPQRDLHLRSSNINLH